MQPPEKLSPLVSILMLTYNRSHFIREAIASVVAQTYTNWQLVVIDDGSSDDTAAVVAAFSDERIIYIRHEENAGLHVRRHESLTYATGKYTAILDSDDSWPEPEKLARQIAYLEANEALALVGTFTNVIDSTGQLLYTYAYATTDLDIRQHITIRNQFTHSGVVMRTALIKKTNGYQPILAEDLELFLQLGQLGTFANLPLYATNHRVHQNSANDHGINMATAVYTIIRRHGHHYPNYTKARIVSTLRVAVGYLKQLLRSGR